MLCHYLRLAPCEARMYTFSQLPSFEAAFTLKAPHETFYWVVLGLECFLPVGLMRHALRTFTPLGQF